MPGSVLSPLVAVVLLALLSRTTRQQARDSEKNPADSEGSREMRRQWAIVVPVLCAAAAVWLVVSLVVWAL